jgi:uncharacterized protein (DUF1330 family)
MTALFFIQAHVPDDADIRRRYREYQTRVTPLIARHGGRLLATGQHLETFEGAPPDRRVIVLQFPSMEALRAFWHSPDYDDVRALRDGCSVTAWAIPALDSPTTVPLS